MKNENHIPDYIKQIQQTGKLEVRVGILGNEDSELATYVRANEFGTSRIPERSYLRAAMVKPSAIKRIVQAGSALTQPGADTKTVLEVVGVVAVGEVQEQIRRGDYVPNAPSTIARKGSAKPLIDTGRLIQSIGYEVA
jgi:hypothetical protein